MITNETVAVFGLICGLVGGLLTKFADHLFRSRRGKDRERQEGEKTVQETLEALWEARQNELVSQVEDTVAQLAATRQELHTANQKLIKIETVLNQVVAENKLLRELVERGLKLNEDEIQLLTIIRDKKNGGNGGMAPSPATTT